MQSLGLRKLAILHYILHRYRLANGIACQELTDIRYKTWQWMGEHLEDYPQDYPEESLFLPIDICKCGRILSLHNGWALRSHCKHCKGSRPYDLGFSIDRTNTGADELAQTIALTLATQDQDLISWLQQTLPNSQDFPDQIGT